MVGWFLLIAGCGDAEVAVPVEVPVAAPIGAPVEAHPEAPSGAPNPAPAPALAEPAQVSPPEYCDPDGWCRPYNVLPFATAAATRDAVAVAGDDLVALWADGAWRGGFPVKEGTRVAEVTREADTVFVVTCTDTRCLRTPWTAAGFGAATPTSRPPDPRRAKLGDWHIAYASLYRGDALRLEPSTALDPVGCAVAFAIVGDEAAPFTVCSQHTARSLHHVVGDAMVTLIEPWATTWVNGGATVHEGAGCAPCLLTSEGILARDDAGWRVFPMPHAAVTPLADFEPGLPRQDAVLAREGDTVFVKRGGRVWTHTGAAATRDGPWSEALPRSTWEGAEAWATPEFLVVVEGGNRFRYRRWADFRPDPDGVAGTSNVQRVAMDDVLNVRAGPHAAAPVLDALAPDARCVQRLDANVHGWQAVLLADGRPGWVAARFLRAAEGCP